MWIKEMFFKQSKNILCTVINEPTCKSCGNSNICVGLQLLINIKSK